MNASLRLAAGDWSATLAPALGGSLTSLRKGARDILRPAEGTSEVLSTSCFPLVPYANRIAQGRFRFGGQDIALPRNFGGHPHSLHGVGWLLPWVVADVADTDAILVHDHDGDARWPWRYRAEQRVALSPEGLDARLSLTNTADRPAPAGLGFHPYLMARPGDRLRFRHAETWLADEDQLVTHAAPADTLAGWTAGDKVFRDALVDHCHGGWDGLVELTGDAGTIRLIARGAPFLHVHIPPGLGFVGVEPVTHMPDALNRPEPAARTGLRVLQPGETLSIDMRIDLVA